jgi:signal transduction histidine kinase
MSEVGEVGAKQDDGEYWQGRLDQVARFAPVPLLAVSAALAALLTGDGYGSWARLWWALGIAAVAALWSLAVTSRRSPGRALASTGFAVQFVLAAVLVGLNPWFGIYAFTGYALAERLPGRWPRAGVVGTALVMAGSQSAGYPTGPGKLAGYLIIAIVNVVLASFFIHLTDRIMLQNAERGRVIEDLAEANRRLEQAMAENAGLHEQLLTQAREAGVQDERQRLAGEIHDTLAQSFVGIVTQLEAAEQAAARPREWHRHLGQARELARSGVREARRSVRALRPEQLERARLEEAVAELGRSWQATWGIPVRIETEGEPRVQPPEVEAALFRVTQEALANVAKHAGASLVGVTLTYLDDVLLLDVRDDGNGFDPHCRPAGFGLAGMRERVGALGGRLAVESAPGEGTAVNATVPMRVAS